MDIALVLSSGTMFVRSNFMGFTVFSLLARPRRIQPHLGFRMDHCSSSSGRIQTNLGSRMDSL